MRIRSIISCVMTRLQEMCLIRRKRSLHTEAETYLIEMCANSRMRSHLACVEMTRSSVVSFPLNLIRSEEEDFIHALRFLGQN